MASVSLSRITKPLGKLLFSRPSVASARVAFVSGKALRPENYERYPPWPYEEKSYSNFHALFCDDTTKRFDENSKVILVDGMPGIGKSDFAKTLADDLDMKYFPMVTTDLMYINPYGYDLRKLDPELPKAARSFDEKRFFREPHHKENIVFQTNLLILKTHQYFDALAHILNTGQGVVVERSPYSDFVFTEAMYKCKYMEKTAYFSYNNYYTALTKLLLKPHLVVYLDAPTEIVYDNLKKRGQGEEHAFTPEFLDTMQEKYKFKFLKAIEEHAEVLIYDWSVPGDVEVIVEDIERIDFDRWETEADKHHPKMKSWRWNNEEAANERRWEYTHKKLELITGTMLAAGTYDCDAEFISGDDHKALLDKIHALPGMAYEVGFNPDKGDNVLFKKHNKEKRANLMKRNFLWSY